MAFADVISDLAGRDVGSPGDAPEAVTQIGTVAVDASMNELHQLSGEATEHPVESGSNISEHFRMKPRQFRIDGMITNHPIKKPGSQVGGVTEVQKEFTWEANPQILGMEVGGAGIIGGALGVVASATGINQHTGTAKGFSPDFDRVTDTFDEFEIMMTLGEPIEIYTALRVYENMVIESFEVDRNKSTASALKFTANAKQIRTVETQFAQSIPDSLVERGKPKKNRGKKANKTPDAATEAVATEKATEKSHLFNRIYAE